jgi:predicted restriction endonuclease
METSFEAFEEESSAAWLQSGLDREAVARSSSGEPSSAAEPRELTMAELDSPTEVTARITARRRQAFFRSVVLTAYRDTCPITGINMPELLVASHIVPWSVDATRRLDPSNGIALNALHDVAFDRGYISFDDEFRVLVSSRVRNPGTSIAHRVLLTEVAGTRAARPVRFDPDPEALEYHRDMIFIP